MKRRLIAAVIAVAAVLGVAGAATTFGEQTTSTSTVAGSSWY